MTWDRLLYFPLRKESILKDFLTLIKNPKASAGFEPAIFWAQQFSMLTIAPPKPIKCVRTENKFSSELCNKNFLILFIVYFKVAFLGLEPIYYFSI